jgi:hypothetical protein
MRMSFRKINTDFFIQNNFQHSGFAKRIISVLGTSKFDAKKLSQS